MNIPPVQIPENVSQAKLPRTRRCIAWICLVVLGGCAALPGIPDTEVAAFGPSVEQVRSLLQQDRVHEALEEALYLTRRYPSGLTETLVGHAMWRNGQVTEAEARFRRAAKTDLAEAYVGLATVRASSGNWPAAMSLLSDVSGNPEADAWALPLLASAAWLSGDVEQTRQRLQAWSRIEPTPRLVRVAAAWAEAVADLEGPPLTWSGEAAVVELEGHIDGGWVVPTRIAGVEGRLLLDLAGRQSSVSPELAEAAGLLVRAGDLAVTGARELPEVTTSRHQPHLLQAACPDLQVGGATLQNAIVGVGQPPDGVDGVVAFDLLSAARWSLRLDGPVLVLGPPGSNEDVHRIVGGSVETAVAWLNARLVRQGLAAQVFVYPLIAGERMAVGIDLERESMLDSDDLPGSSAPRSRLQMGGWRGEVEWEIAQLEVWASAGGVAPGATLGHNLIADWILHWLPEQEQIRFDRAVTGRSLAGTAHREGTLR